MQNLIIWQKWMDPFGSDDEEILDQLEPEFYDEENNAIKTEGKAEEDDDIMQELGEDFKDRFQSLNFTVEQHG